MMVDPTLTLALEGDISLDTFVKGVDAWRRFVSALSAEVCRASKIEWLVEELSSGSTLITVRTESDDRESIQHIVSEYLVVARGLEAGQVLHYSAELRRYAYELVDILNVDDNVQAIRFQTSDDDVTIVARESDERPAPAALRAYGAISGRVQTLSSRNGLRFTVYDSIFDKAVSCFLREGQEELIENKWNHRVNVEGMLSRDPLSGRPIAIRGISAITRLPDSPEGDYQEARRVLP
ncbi:MAG TPA: hypothetical protein VHV31_13730, partial [Nitrolancea sp.]|nr:hypothetical protein [Nitrolancea sp.]